MKTHQNRSSRREVLLRSCTFLELTLSRTTFGLHEFDTLDFNSNPYPQDLAVRNTDLPTKLRKDIKGGYGHISEMCLSDAIIGDIGFLDNPVQPDHAFMTLLSTKWRAMEAVVFRHGSDHRPQTLKAHVSLVCP